MSFLAVHPGQPLPDFQASAQVDPNKPSVHVEVDPTGAAGGNHLGIDLAPAFIWDPSGYAPLAGRLLGGTVPAAVPSPASQSEDDILTHLLNLTASELATEDVRLSANLQKNPASWQDHEAAALLLTAMSLREQGGVFGDSRAMLNRATAHLAMAVALRQGQAPSWPGLVADAAIRALAGREVDAVTHLDQLDSRTDCPAAAKTWITVLRLVAKDDWRLADPHADAPLALKIAWFRALCDNLEAPIAVQHFQQAVAQPTPDPNLPPDQQKQNPETLLADWGRIAGASPFYDNASDPIQNCEYKLDIELHELDVALQIEGDSHVDFGNPSATLAVPQVDTVSPDANGQPIVHVIGAPMFRDDTRRHIIAAIPEGATDSSNESSTVDTAQVKAFQDKMDLTMRDVPGYEYVQLNNTGLDPDGSVALLKKWANEKKTVPVWEMPSEMGMGLPGYDHARTFFTPPLPFGTVYDLGPREIYVTDVGTENYPKFDEARMAQIKKLPIDEQIKQFAIYRKQFNDSLYKAEMKAPSPYERQLLQLHPDNFFLATDHMPADEKLLAALRPYLDYDQYAVKRAGSLAISKDDVTGKDLLTLDDKLYVIGKEAAFEPGYSIDLGSFLLAAGKPDDAAAADRKYVAMDHANDDSGAPASAAMRLVDYDLEHGLNDEALAVGRRAATFADGETGQYALFDALEGTGHLDEARQCAHDIATNYDDTSPEILLFSAHRDKFPDLNAAEEKRIFPNGVQPASLKDFTDPPVKGVVLQGDDRRRADIDLAPTGLRFTDIFVALDGHQINTAMQYFYIKAMTRGSDMDFILYRDGKYVEVHAHVTHRRFPTLGVTDYPTQPGQ